MAQSPITKVLLVSLFSFDHPAVGESLGIAVLGGCLENAFQPSEVHVTLLDLYATDRDRESELLETVTEFKPDIIGFSVTYGTYAFLERVYPKLLRRWNKENHLTVFGGPIPTFAPEQFIPNIDPSALVVAGEGDDSIIQIVKCFRENKPYDAIPNIHLLRDGKVHKGPRKLTDLSIQPLPKRTLVARALTLGGQIFVETSRGCSWADCTLCRRGVTDFKGTPDEYRRYPVLHVINDLINLYNIGVRSVTFADEEFIGHIDNSILDWLLEFKEQLNKHSIKMRFDISVMVRSVLLDLWDGDEKEKRKKIWDILQEIGLRKVFLGIESGSTTQLKRFGKNATPLQNANAIQLLRSRNIEVECGFIMFDPLCTRDELIENINFIKSTNIVGYISSLSNELRIDKDGTYYRLLLSQERKRGENLFERPYDPSTLTFKPLYLDKQVSTIVNEVREWRKVYGKLHYIAKAMTRYGSHGAVGESNINMIRNYLFDLRDMYFDNFSNLVVKSSLNNDDILLIRHHFHESINQFAKKSLPLINLLKESNFTNVDLINTLESSLADILSSLSL